MIYKKDKARINVKFLDGDTNEELFEIKDRDVTNIGEVFSDFYVSEVAKNYFESDELPDNIIVLVVSEYEKMI